MVTFPYLCKGPRGFFFYIFYDNIVEILQINLTMLYCPLYLHCRDYILLEFLPSGVLCTETTQELSELQQFVNYSHVFPLWSWLLELLPLMRFFCKLWLSVYNHYSLQSLGAVVCPVSSFLLWIKREFFGFFNLFSFSPVVRMEWWLVTSFYVEVVC